MDFNTRIQHIVDQLFSGNKSQFAKIIGEAPTSISNILGPKKSTPSAKLLNNIMTNIPSINPMWLLTGEGELLVNEKVTQITDVPTTKEDIAILDIRVCAGQGVGLEGRENKVIGYVNIPDFIGCYGITVYGDSMYDKYAPGDTIFVREIKEKNMIDNGQPYVVITREDRLLKMVYVEHDGLKLVSYNTICNPDGRRKYPDMCIDGNQILHLYKIVGKLARTQM